MNKISSRDLGILRELAKKQMEIAEAPEMAILKKKWIDHNALRGERPMVKIELGTFGNELILPLMKCEGEEARGYEHTLLSNTYNVLNFGDDTFVGNYYPMARWGYLNPLGIDVKVDHTDGLGHHFVPAITDLEDDFHKIKKSPYGFWETEEQFRGMVDNVSEIFGESMPVRVEGGTLYVCLTQNLVHLMSMEDMFVSMYDYPDLFKQMINGLADDYLEYFDFLEAENAILPTVDGQGVGNGTFAFGDELPSSGILKTNDVWGFCDSQETVGISNEMFGEFIFPAYKRIAERYGLLSYGCCEPVHQIYDDYLSKFKNLRKLSVSPWSDERFIGERLAGTKTIYHRKPSPNFIGVGTTLDEDACRKHIAETVEAAKNCKLEITVRDVYTVNNDPNKVKKFVDIIKEEIERRF